MGQGLATASCLRQSAGALRRVEAVRQAAAVDIESFENFADRGERDAPVQGPQEDIEVFLSGFETIEDAVADDSVLDSLPRAAIAVKADLNAAWPSNLASTGISSATPKVNQIMNEW